MNTLLQLVRTMRPAQWVKNLFVLAPVLFAKEHTAAHPALVLDALLGTAIFVLLSGAVYILNDVLDAGKDRLHPVKCRRPVASGAIFIVGLKIGLYAVIRFILPLVPGVAEQWSQFVLTLSLISIFYGALLALMQINIRRLLAFSVVSHTGMLMIGLFCFNDFG